MSENTDIERNYLKALTMCRDLLKNCLSLDIPDVSTRCMNSFISPALFPLMLHPVLQRSQRPTYGSLSEQGQQQQDLQTRALKQWRRNTFGRLPSSNLVYKKDNVNRTKTRTPEHLATVGQLYSFE